MVFLNRLCPRKTALNQFMHYAPLTAILLSRQHKYILFYFQNNVLRDC